MITPNLLTLATYDVNTITLSWAFEPSTESVLNFKIDIYRSETPGVSGIGEYLRIASGISANAYSFTDTTVSGLMHPNRTWFYKILVKHNTTQETRLYPSTPSYYKSTPDYIARSIIGSKKLALDKKVTRPMYLLKKYNFGTRCTACWDDILYRTTKADCNVCKGTGFITGYYDPIPFNATLTAAPKYNQMMVWGDWSMSDRILYTIGYPPMKPKDIVIDDTNMRWLVGQVRPIEFRGLVVEQQVQLVYVQPDDVIYNIIP